MTRRYHIALPLLLIDKTLVSGLKRQETLCMLLNHYDIGLNVKRLSIVVAMSCMCSIH